MASEAALQAKVQRLREIVRAMGRAVVGFSGGVDSTLVLKVALDELGPDNVIAVIANSETYPAAELDEARRLAAHLGAARLETVATKELAREVFARNAPDRCFHCKTELYGRLWEVARRVGTRCVLDGTHADDLLDHRPGMRAAGDLAVRSPLLEADMTKADVREAARGLGLPNWNKPSFACLASRFPYGDRITVAKLRQVEEAESVLRRLGLCQFRVRHHGDIARIEIKRADFPRLLAPGVAEAVTGALRGLGFRYVTLDLEGYRRGRMNEALPVSGEA